MSAYPYPERPRFSVATLTRSTCYVRDLAPVHPRADRVAFCEAGARFALRAARLCALFAPTVNACEVARYAEGRSKAARTCRTLRASWQSPCRTLSSIPEASAQRSSLRGWIARYEAQTLRPLHAHTGDSAAGPSVALSCLAHTSAH